MQERSRGRFTRVITLPFAVKGEHVNAEFKNGLLELNLTKLTASRVQVA